MSRVIPNPEFRREYADTTGVEWQRTVGHTTHAHIVAGAPRWTGDMQQESSVEPFTDEEGRPAFRVSFRRRYTELVDQGTGLYGPLKRWITPQTAKVLSWIDRESGKRVFAKRVRGQPGQRFFYRGLVAVFGESRVREYRYGRKP